jgi:hypothetical protein
MLDRMTIIRSMDVEGSNHEPNRVIQAGYRDAEPRTNPRAERYPAIGSVVAKHYGPNHPSMPGYATFMTSRSHVAFAGDLGKTYDPMLLNQAVDGLPLLDYVGKESGARSKATLFSRALGLTDETITQRRSLLSQFDSLRRDLDRDDSMRTMDQYSQKALEMLMGGQMAKALAWQTEPERTRAKYGPHLWCQQALIARRMVEAGTSFITIDLSYHPASGTWDTHGDNIPPYGGISKGLKPLLPLFEQLWPTLIDDLTQRGLIDDCLVIAMGEFGRTPKMGTQDSTDGRDHWPSVGFSLLAGGGFNHGQVIGASESDGGKIKERPVTPGDLAATIYHHFGLSQDLTYNDFTGRPIMVVQENGKPIKELVG